MPSHPEADTIEAPATRGRPKDMAKRRAILDAAQLVFSEKGFGNASMETIAKAAGVSKLTLYSHFEDKDDLFISTVELRCFEQIPMQLLEEQYHSLSAHDALFKLGRAALDAYLAPQSIATYRLMAAESGMLHPDLMRTYYAAAVGGMTRRFVVVLQYIGEQGAYHFPHLRRTAAYFLALVKDGVHARYVFNVQPLPTREEQDLHLREVVDLFLRAHRA